MTSILFLILAALVVAQQPAAASVEGIVVKHGTNVPISGVTVELRKLAANATGGNASPTSAALILSVKTADDGRYAFRNVPAGTYRLMGSREDGAYNPQEYLWKPNRLRGVAIPLEPGQVLKDARIELIATGSISGRIIDRDGDPVGNARVIASQPWYEQGKPQMSIVQIAQTNDRGEYRLYWLPAGTYYIAVRPESSEQQTFRTMPNINNSASNRGEYRAHEGISVPPITRRVLDSGQIVEETYELVYYPGVTESQKARAVDVAPGANLNGVDISLAAGTVRARTIRGVISYSSAGPQAPHLEINVVPENASPSLIMPVATVRENGTFSIQELASEPYFLAVTARFPAPPGGVGMVQSALIPLEPGTTDIEHLAVGLKPGAAISGRVIVDGQLPGASAPDYTRMQVGFVADLDFATRNVLPNLRAPLSPNGTFTVPSLGPAGLDFRVAVQGLPPGAYVKSMRWDGAEVISGRVRIAGDSPGQLEITVGVGMATLDVRVVDERSQPYANAMVALLPASPSMRRIELHKSLPSGLAGQVSFVDIVPGDYKIFPMDQVLTGAWLDNGYMRAYESRGTLVHIQPGSKGTAEAPLIHVTQ